LLEFSQILLISLLPINSLVLKNKLGNDGIASKMRCDRSDSNLKKFVPDLISIKAVLAVDD
jgi:hypothetical protein